MKLIFSSLFFIVFASFAQQIAFANDSESYISSVKTEGSFVLSESGKSAPLYASSEDYPGVIRVLEKLQADINSVTNSQPDLFLDKHPESDQIVLVGTLGKNNLIDELVKTKKLDDAGISGKWETFVIQVVENPFPNVDRALVIAGSDKRGTIYGMFDLSEKIGVSPWYWWADVPVKKKDNVYVLPVRFTMGEPQK